MPTGIAQTSAALAASVAGMGAALTAARLPPRHPVHCSADSGTVAMSASAASAVPKMRSITMVPPVRPIRP